MVAFPWLVGILILALLAELVLLGAESLTGSIRERRRRLVRPSRRAILALTIVEIVLVLVWGLFLRPH